VNVSVVVPVYNGARYLPEAIASVRAQTAPPSEVIVVDDGSTDGSGDLARSLGAVCIRQERLGIAGALNTGARHAAGDAIAFLDADDVWTPEKLALQLAALGKRSDLDGVFGLAQQFVSPDLPVEEQARLRCPAEPQAGIHAGALLIRRPSFERTSGFDEELGVGEFIDWYIRATELGLKLELLDELVLRRRLHDSNTMRVRRGEVSTYAHVLKAALDRRRAEAR
jgi:glycosyltransferase involved in cell wall biosynthesis